MPGTLDTAIKENKRYTEGRKAVTMMNNVGPKISVANKQRMYNSILNSIVTYGSEVRQWLLSRKKMLLTPDIDFRRRRADKSRRAKVRNEKIREIRKATHTIVEDLRTK